MGCDLSGQVALVTGGRYGIGRAAAVALARAGADVAVSSRRGDDLAPVLEEIRAAGRRALGIALDLRGRQADADRAAAEVADRLGRLDILVNNAGVAVTAPALEMAEPDWDETFDVNVRGPFLLSRAAAERMRDAGGGAIVNLSSTFAVTARPGRAAYGASKAALGQLTKGLAVEWAPFGIRVNAVAPCATLTPGRPHMNEPEARARLEARIALGRIAEPDDIAGAIVFLADRSSRFVTGHTLMVDGGWTAW